MPRLKSVEDKMHELWQAIADLQKKLVRVESENTEIIRQIARLENRFKCTNKG